MRWNASARVSATIALTAALLIALLPAPAGAAAKRGRILPAGKAVPGSYVVMLESTVPSVPDVATSLARLHGGELGWVYNHALKGFSIEIDRAGALAISADPRVKLVEEDPVVHAVATQSSPPYGLDRIDQRNLPLSGSYVYNATGSGATAYIVDSGVRRHSLGLRGPRLARLRLRRR